MLNEIEKLAFCPKCSSNVPHCRKMNGLFAGLLQKLGVGPWHCVHCRRKSMILPAVSRSTEGYHNFQPSVPAASDKPKNESLSCSVEEDRNEKCEFSVEGGFEDDHNHENSSLDRDLKRGEVCLEGDFNGSQTLSSDVEFNSGPASPSLVESSGTNFVLVNSPSDRNDRFKSEAMPEAEPIGNFLKAKSLVLKSTRLERFTEKFRDSVVKRILSGSVSVSSLVADGEYSESELMSWIADKARRQEQESGALDLDKDRWSEQPPRGGFRPLDPR